jgi:hypothetical protein
MRVGSWALCFHRQLQGFKKGVCNLRLEGSGQTPFSFWSGCSLRLSGRDWAEKN